MNERIYRTEAVVLGRRDFGEADRLITLYTQGYGKRRVIAKGVRKTTSKLVGHLELFTRAQLLLAVGRNLHIITQAQVITPYRSLRDDLTRFGYACYAAELLDKTTKEDEENRPLYNLLVQTLAGIDSAPLPGLVVRFYELRLLGLIGYQPYLFHCARCQTDLTEAADHWIAPDGMLCPACTALTPGAMPMALSTFKALRFLQRQPLADVVQLQLSEGLQSDLEAVLRRMLRPVLERDLKSLTFLNAVRG